MLKSGVRGVIPVMGIDRDQLGALYARFGALVYRRARALLREDQASQDACQEVFLKLWRAQLNFSEESPVAWLFQVTTNHCLNVLRHQRRQGALAAAHAAVSVEAADGGISLPLLLRGIPEHLHELAVYYYIDEMTQDEIALVLHVSQRTVSNRIEEFRTLVKRAWGRRAAAAS